MRARADQPPSTSSPDHQFDVLDEGDPSRRFTEYTTLTPKKAVSMLDVHRPTSMLSTVSSDHQYPYLPASTAPGTKTAFMSEERGREAREHASYGLSVSNQNFISRWLEGSRGANSQGPLTPPTEMTAANANPMLAPTYGGLYNSVPAVKLNTSQLQTNIGNYAGKSMGQPGHVSATQAQSPSQTKDAAWPAEITARRRSSSNGNQIVSYLQIPATINDSKGSLAEFAAQVSYRTIHCVSGGG